MEFENKWAEKNKKISWNHLVRFLLSITNIFVENMAAQINQLINQAMDLDDSIDTMIWMMNALFWTMIVSPILPLILPSLSLKSTMIFELILAVIGKLIWIAVLENYDQVQQLYNQADHLRSLPSLDGDQNRWSDHFIYLNMFVGPEIKYHLIFNFVIFRADNFAIHDSRQKKPN